MSQSRRCRSVSRVTSWEEEHSEVERNGGLVFGTLGLLTLQFVVATIAAVASSFVFLSLVLTQRKRELAILQVYHAIFQGKFQRGVVCSFLSVVFGHNKYRMMVILIIDCFKKLKS